MMMNYEPFPRHLNPKEPIAQCLTIELQLTNDF